MGFIGAYRDIQGSLKGVVGPIRCYGVISGLCGATIGNYSGILIALFTSHGITLQPEEWVSAL